MRTRILSLLLALLAINNFSFAQDKHTHSVPFHKAVAEMYGLEAGIEFHDEAPINGLEASTSLKVFKDATEKVTFGMFMDQSKYNHYYNKVNGGEVFTTDCYTWVFEINDFKSRCKDKKMGNFKLDDKVFSLEDLDKYKACERISQLMGIDIYPEHIWLCTFTVDLDNIFRPAYQTSIISSDFVKNNGKWKVNDEGIINLPKKEIKSATDSNIQHISPSHWLGLLQESKEYPWTRMGYTYDWGNTEDHVGVSEFVIVPGTEVKEVNFYKVKDL